MCFSSHKEVIIRTLDSQTHLQLSEEVNYGAQPDVRVEEYDDYDREEDRIVAYRYVN